VEFELQEDSDSAVQPVQLDLRHFTLLGDSLRIALRLAQYVPVRFFYLQNSVGDL
jgi:hypothetical protein